MAQMLPILLLFLASFTPQATAKKPGPLTVIVDPQYIPFSNVRRFNVYLAQAKEANEFDSEDDKFEDCEKPKVSLTKTSPIEFTLDWSKCPQAVERPEQLRHMRIEIDVVYKGGRGQQQPNHIKIWLERYSSANFYRQVFGGGKAKLVKILGTFPKLEYLEDPTGTPSASSHLQQHASASISTRALLAKSEKQFSEKPGPLTVTIDPQYISNVHYFDVYLKQAEEENEFAFKDCANPTLVSTNPVEFTLDWSRCPRAVEHPEQLRHLYIELDVVYKPDGQRNQPNYVEIWLKDYSDGFYRKVFGGGKARLVKILTTDNYNKSEEAPKLVFLEDPTGTPIPPAGTLTFNVEYQHRAVSSIRRVAVSHPSIKVVMGECRPENMRGGKFLLDLAKCNVHDLADFLDLKMELRVALQKGQHPNRIEGRTERFEFGMLSGQPEDVLRHAHQMNILLSEQYKPMISLSGEHWENVRESTSTSSHQHAGASSHALQFIPKSQEELSEAEASAGYFEGRKSPSTIVFRVADKILEGPPRVIEHKGKLILVDSRDIHLVNDEEHEMKLWHADGTKCPVEIAGDFSAVLQIDWTKCTPNQPKSHEELEGMELVVYYQLNQDEPKQIRHTFKQDEPLQSVFYGTYWGRLQLLEDGSVVFKRNG